jgi:acyl carrier protein|nr:MAG TPA: acyl carrier protein [Caudoviricetes sp.]
MHTEERVMDIIRGYDIDAKVGDRFKDDLRFDSLDMVEIALTVEKEFSISIPDEEMFDPAWDTATVQDLIDFVDRKLDERRKQNHKSRY